MTLIFHQTIILPCLLRISEPKFGLPDPKKIENTLYFPAAYQIFNDVTVTPLYSTTATPKTIGKPEIWKYEANTMDTILETSPSLRGLLYLSGLPYRTV